MACGRAAGWQLFALLNADPLARMDMIQFPKSYHRNTVGGCLGGNDLGAEINLGADK